MVALLDHPQSVSSADLPMSVMLLVAPDPNEPCTTVLIYLDFRYELKEEGLRVLCVAPLSRFLWSSAIGQICTQ